MLWELYGISEPDTEYQFHDKRNWRFDFAWPMVQVAVEIEGGAWSRGRHTRGKGFLEDMKKYNAAAEMGWRILRFAPNAVDYAQVKRALEHGLN